MVYFKDPGEPVSSDSASDGLRWKAKMDESVQKSMELLKECDAMKSREMSELLGGEG